MTNPKTDPNEARLLAIDSAILKPLVEKKLNRTNLSVIYFEYARLDGGFGGGRGGTAIYRFNGAAEDQDETIRWSLILKVIQARPDESPDSTHYWKREAELYRSGLLDDLPRGILAARGLGVVEFPGESCWIWQEFLEDSLAGNWGLEQYRLVARNLGLFNGAYLAGRALPNHEWLSTGWLRQISLSAEADVEPILGMLRSPALKDWWPPDAEAQFLCIWTERGRLLDMLDQLPQTFSHQDALRFNLFLRRGEKGDLETIAIDWAYAGISAVGMDIAAAVMVSLVFLVVSVAPAQELADEHFAGYLEGLRESGYTGDTRVVRLGFLASSVCKYFELLMLMTTFDPLGTFLKDKYFELLMLITTFDLEGPLGTFLKEQIVRSNFNVFELVQQFADEAKALMDELGY